MVCVLQDGGNDLAKVGPERGSAALGHACVVGDTLVNGWGANKI